GLVDDPNQAIGAGNIAVLKSATTFRLPERECSVTAATGDFPLTLTAGSGASFAGFITGNGSLRIEPAEGKPLEFSGAANNAFKGPTTLTRGVLNLHKPANTIAILGDLTVDEDAAVIWEADGQIAPSASVTLHGSRSSFLDLNGHSASFSRL